MIDLHCHLLPGLDDGPATMEDALALARAAHDAGTRTIVATPHVDHRWRVAPEAIADAVTELRAALAAADIAVEVLGGAEIAIPRLIELDEAALACVTIGDGPYLLVESPHIVAAGDFHAFVISLRRKGRPIVLAHPERCPTLMRNPGRVAEMVKAGVLCSITSSALEGAFGQPVRHFALDLLAAGMVHNLASDSHDATRRAPPLLGGLASAERELPGIGEHAEWLTRTVPEAVLAGEEPPPSPPLPARRRSRLGGLLTRLR